MIFNHKRYIFCSRDVQLPNSFDVVTFANHLFLVFSLHRFKASLLKGQKNESVMEINEMSTKQKRESDNIIG